MQALRRAAPVGQRQRDDRHAERREQIAQLDDGRVVRAVGEADAERVVVQPERVAAVHRRLAADGAEDRHVEFIERPAHRLLLAAPQRFPRLRDDRPGIRDDGRVVDEDRIQEVRRDGDEIVLIDHLRAGGRDERDEGVVLGAQPRGIRRVEVAEFPPVRRVRRRLGRSFDEDAPQWRDE